ncbi:MULTISPECIES: hypothetical protein [Paenibacillus]|uniref:hypothetical protein n=1 Tax=Paenibacillus TaxID=44249 RepID=UPI0022B87EA1|nr:hypothetical protein [Paenibacillus caseinilyticus]MCZ8521596.1 hypothetical protein [Paenibacillus caseinilyticus]
MGDGSDGLDMDLLHERLKQTFLCFDGGDGKHMVELGESLPHLVERDRVGSALSKLPFGLRLTLAERIMPGF